MTTLHKFEGREVVGTKVAIRRAGDGLSKAMAIEPQELRSGDRVFVVMECEVGKIGFTPVKDTRHMTRDQDLVALTVTIVEKEMVAEVLAAQRAKIEEAEARASLDFEGDGDGGN